MNKWKLILGLALALCISLGALSGSTLADTQETLSWSVIGGGGNVGAQLSSTAGQTAIGWSIGAQQLGSGFWYGIGSGGVTYPYSIYLPLVVK